MLDTAFNDTARKGWVLGLDVGGTKIAALAADDQAVIRGQVILPTDLSSNPGTVASICATVEQVLRSAGAAMQQVSAIGIGIPGLVRGGVVEMAVNLNLQSFALAAVLEQRFGVPVVVENDVRTAALGVYDYFQERESLHSLAYLSIGTGISAGLILDGRLYRGANGMAGEIGHVSLDADGPHCNCGLPGCLETFSAGPALAAFALQARQNGTLSTMDQFAVLDGTAVYQAYREGDAVAQHIIQQSAFHLSRAIQWLVMGYDVEKVVLGGGVASQGEAFLNPIQQELERLREQSPLARRMLAAEKIVLLPPDIKPSGWGAVVLGRRMVASPAQVHV
jgi:glucokinase